MAGNANSGGARMRSGPPADPNSLRSDRKGADPWVTLPAEPVEVVPDFPLSEATAEEKALWRTLWGKPQGHMWAALGLEWQVAHYVRTFLEASAPRAVNGLKTAALRMEAELGLSTVGMGHLHWKFATDELAERREDAPQRSSSMKNRLKAVNGGG